MTETAVDAMLQAELERARGRRVSELGEEALAWLALPPVWTDRVARACGFPEVPVALEDLLARAEAVGWCVRRESETRGRTPHLRLHLLVELAVGEESQARALLSQVVAVADESLRAQLLVKLAARAPDGLSREIRSVAETVADPAARADVLLALVAAGHLEAAGGELRRLVARIGDPRQRAVRLLRAVNLMGEPDAAWSTEARALLDQLGNDTALKARLLKEAARWLPGEETLRHVAGLEGRASTLALADLAVAVAWSGDLDRAPSMAASIPDDRVRTHALIEMLVPGIRADPDRWNLVLVHPDVLAMARQVERLIEAERREQAAAVADRLIDAATPANVGALQQAAAAVVPALKTPHARALLERSAALATQIGDPAARAACLAGAVDLARRFGRPDPVPVAALVAAAGDVHDDEDRAWALARVAPLLGPAERESVAGEALALGATLDEGAVVVTFWAPSGAREQILDELRRRRGFTWVHELTATIGQRVQRARSGPTVVPAALARWAELAAVASGTDGARRAAAALDDRVGRLLEAGEAGQALAWLDTARLLGVLLLGDFETSVLANTRRVELLHRRELDRRRLTDFLPRTDQLSAFEALLDQRAEGVWALHYLGAGGVGKTMLIRHLTADLAPAKGVVTSRIDFDHLNPDFPRRRPAQLLLELITELEPHAQGRRHMYLFRQAYEQLQEINAAAGPGAPAVTVSSPAFARAVRTFGGFLESLEAPVVLILDTCEELEKLQPAGGRIEQLEATFDLIEALHDAAPSLRVVLAGRRPLARSGHGWRLAGTTEPLALLPERKPYLAFHEIRGFDRAEAEEFLGRVKGLRLGSELLEAILDRSPDPGTAATVDRAGDQGPPEVNRYNPFDLDHYATWARAEPGLDAAAVTARESDVYVEARIIGRLKHAEVERLLPAVTALGRFDREMLRPASDADEAAFADAWRELAATEWIDIQPDAALGTTFLEIDRAVRPRLEAHYRRPERRALLHEAARRLGPGLARIVQDRTLDRLGLDHVATAMRLLQPAEAARLVDRLAWKVIEEGAWGWAELVAERVLADHPGLGDADHPAAAGLRAMLASAILHLDPERDLDALWQSVQRAASAHPDPETGQWLGLRAELGRRQGSIDRLLPAVAETTDERRRQVLVGGLLAALHDRLDRAEAAEDRRLLWDPANLEAIVWTEPPAARAFARVLSARVRLLGARFDDAERLLGEAVALATEPEGRLGPWLLADWLPPEDLVERVWLEALRSPVREAALSFPGPPPIAGERLGGIDKDRLASAALRRRLDQELVPDEELAAYERLADLMEVRRPSCQAQRAVPPFFITVVRGWLALGEAEPALALLRRGRDAAIAGRDRATARLVDLTMLEVARRLRLHQEAWSVRERLLSSKDPVERQAAWSAAALLDPPEGLPPRLDPVPAEPPSFGAWIAEHPLRWEQGVRLGLRRMVQFEAGIQEMRRESALWMQWLGKRRVAELLLAEGEVVALDLPAEAVPAIDLATDLFEEAGDTVGRFAATTVAALARARAGDDPGDAWWRLKETYGRFQRERSTVMPGWSELTAALAEPGGRAARVLLGGSPWLHRLLVAMAWAMRPQAVQAVVEAVAKAGSRSAELRIAPQPGASGAAAGLASTGTIAPLPAQTAPYPEPAVPGASASEPQIWRTHGTGPGAPAPAPARSARRGRRLLLLAAAAVAAAALGVLLAVQSPLGVGAPPGAIEPGQKGGLPGWLVPALLAVATAAPAAVAGWLLWRGSSAVRAWLRRRRRQPVSVAVSGPVSEVMFEWSLASGDRRVIANGRALRSGPYEPQRDVLPGAIQRALRGHPVSGGLALRVSREVAATPWEAPILLLLDDLRIPCWRQADAPAPRSGARSRWRRRWPALGRVPRSMLAPATWARLVEESLGQVRALYDPVAPTGAAKAWELLVIISVPVETSAGLRLLVESSTKRGSAPEGHVQPDELPYQRLGLVVVMGEPSESLVRVDAEREQAGDLRHCAAELMSAGAEAVLCLPAMPAGLAGRALRSLDSRLSRIRRRGWREVAAAATDIRQEIAAAGRDAHERASARELALEVTVFVRP